MDYKNTKGAPKEKREGKQKKALKRSFRENRI
jgi:hypothetical protein